MTSEAVLISLDDIEPIVEVLNYALREEPSIEKAKQELILYASLLTRAPEYFLFGSMERKARLHNFFCPHAKHIRNNRDKFILTGVGDGYFPDTCIRCYHFFGQTRSGRVRGTCPECRVSGRPDTRNLWSNIQYEYQQIEPAGINTEALFSQIITKYYSPNLLDTDKSWPIQIPLFT